MTEQVTWRDLNDQVQCVREEVRDLREELQAAFSRIEERRWASVTHTELESAVNERNRLLMQLEHRVDRVEMNFTKLLWAFVAMVGASLLSIMTLMLQSDLGI